MQFTSFVVSGIAEQPGVFGWLMIRTFEDAGCCSLAGFLSVSIRELTVGVYEEIAKSEMHEPGGDLSVWLYSPAAWSGRNARGPVGHHQIRAGSDAAVDFDKNINEKKCRDLRKTHGECKSIQDWPHHTQPKCLENKIYITLLFGIGTRCRACGTINFSHANPMRREEKPQTISELRRLVISKIKRDVHGGSDTGNESQGVTAVFVNVDQNHDGIRWEAREEV